LRNPYFAFPQNYGYGLASHSYDEELSESSKSFHHNSSPKKSFNLYELTTEENHKEHKRPLSFDNKENEHREVELTIFENKLKPEMVEPSPPNATASIFKEDLSVFFSSNPRKNTEDLANFDPFTPKGTLTNLNSELFEANGPIENHFNRFDSISILKSPILQKRSIGPLSPINTMNLLNKKRDSDKTAKTPFFFASSK